LIVDGVFSCSHTSICNATGGLIGSAQTDLGMQACSAADWSDSCWAGQTQFSSEGFDRSEAESVVVLLSKQPSRLAIAAPVAWLCMTACCSDCAAVQIVHVDVNDCGFVDTCSQHSDAGRHSWGNKTSLGGWPGPAHCSGRFAQDSLKETERCGSAASQAHRQLSKNRLSPIGGGGLAWQPQPAWVTRRPLPPLL
jgi:hypothetical protein